MTVTQRYLFKPDSIEGAAKSLGIYETPIDGYIRAIYTRQQHADWKYCMGQCVLGQDAGDDLREVYPAFAFLSKTLHGITLQNLVRSLTGDDGIHVAPNLPPLRMTASPANWKEEIVPSHATDSGMPARRFRVAIEANAVFANDQLIDYELPYRPSAERYVKAFLRLSPRDAVERGEFAIDIPDRRGAIRMSAGHLCIVQPRVPLRLVGEIDGTPIDLKNDSCLKIEEKNIRNVELWLVTQSSEVVDYISTTHWPYKYEATLRETAQEEELRNLIRQGESEICEFKPYIDLSNQKEAEIEKTVCAFSNQRGGTLFIGVNNEGVVVGLARDVSKRPDDVVKAIEVYEKALRARLREALKDNQCFTTRLATVFGVQLIVVEVRRSAEVNYLVRSDLANIAFIRHGATSARMSPAEIQAKGGTNAQSGLRHAVFGS
jgi:hypothetical protein